MGPIAYLDSKKIYVLATATDRVLLFPNKMKSRSQIYMLEMSRVRKQAASVSLTSKYNLTGLLIVTSMQQTPEVYHFGNTRWKLNYFYYFLLDLIIVIVEVSVRS